MTDWRCCLSLALASAHLARSRTLASTAAGDLAAVGLGQRDVDVHGIDPVGQREAVGGEDRVARGDQLLAQPVARFAGGHAR